MARSTSTKEASVVTFFTTAPLAVANTVFGIVRAQMKTRNTPAVAPKSRKKITRKPRAVKTSPSPVAGPAAEVVETLVA